MSSSYPQDFRKDLEPLVVGRRIMGVEDNTITLDNGTTVQLSGSSDCCAWGDVNVLQNLAYTDHVITAVTETPADDSAYTESARWFIMADLHQVLEIEGEWDASNGYYFYGFYIDVNNG